MLSESVREFLASLEPRWEDPHEFDWLRSGRGEKEGRVRDAYPFELNRFPGLKMVMETS